MASGKRSEILSELSQQKQALIASEKRGRKAVKKLRDIEACLEKIKPRMEAWLTLPVAEDSMARVMTTGECRKLLKLLSKQDILDKISL